MIHTLLAIILILIFSALFGLLVMAVSYDVNNDI